MQSEFLAFRIILGLALSFFLLRPFITEYFSREHFFWSSSSCTLSLIPSACNLYFASMPAIVYSTSLVFMNLSMSSPWWAWDNFALPAESISLETFFTMFISAASWEASKSSVDGVTGSSYSNSSNRSSILLFADSVDGLGSRLSYVTFSGSYTSYRLEDMTFER